MSSPNAKVRKVAPLNVPQDERFRSYIPNRIARLRRRKKWIEAIAWVVVVAGVIHSFTVSSTAGAAAAGLGLLGRLIGLDLCNLYIDLLVAQWRDLDRDIAQELFDFETPMNVPPEPL